MLYFIVKATRGILFAKKKKKKEWNDASIKMYSRLVEYCNIKKIQEGIFF